MPELDGIALATALRAAEAGTGTPVIVLSSLGVHERENDAVAAFLVKPVKPSALYDAIATVLAGQAAAVAGPADRRRHRPRPRGPASARGSSSPRTTR